MSMRTSSRGFSLVETTLVLGITGLLATVGVSSLDLCGGELTAVQHELQTAVEQAQILAHARGRDVVLGVRTLAEPEVIPLKLPRKVRWGKPASIPLPKGMKDPAKADSIGESRPRIVISHRRTAQAATWFLNDGKEALCFRLNDFGHLQTLRWSPKRRTWMKV